jgi:hypothetical protein
MEALKGNLIVTMRFEIPVGDHMYPRIKAVQGVVHPADIVAAEEQNYLANVDNYLDLVGDHITEVEFSFEQTMRGANE